MTMTHTIAFVSAFGLAIAVTACGDGKQTTANTAPASQTTASPPSPTPPPVSTPEPTPVPPPAAGGVDPATTAHDSAATDPKGTLTKEEESKSMPEAGQTNNHSSTALDASKK